MTAAEVDRRVARRFRAEQGTGDARTRLAELLVEADPLLGDAEVAERVHRLAGELLGLGPLQQLLDDPAVSDVLANGPGPVWVERAGRLERTDVVVDTDQLHAAIERLVAPLGLHADRAHPIVDARLADGTRVAAVLSPLAVGGPVLAVRRHLRRPLPLAAFGTDAVVGGLTRLVHRGANVVVYGPTGSGKTTVVNALAATLPTDERIVTIEDVAELRVAGEHVVRLEARPGSADGVGRVGMRELVRASLRLRPDRIIVGEVRGAEAADMIWAMSTGHRGGLSTCHAGGPGDALARLETMCLLGLGRVDHSAVRAQVRAAVDVLVGVARDENGGRRIDAVHAVTGGGVGEDLMAGWGR